MLRAAIRHVHPEHLDALTQWLKDLNGPRRLEALATLADEGCRQEQAWLIAGADGPVIVYVMEVEDVERSRRTGEQSTHPIDAEHRRVITTALGGDVKADLVLDLGLATPPDDGGAQLPLGAGGCS